MSSFQQGLSGLNASSKNLEVIGNNIANANTFGAKTSRAEFADAYANALNGASSNKVGIGVTLQTVAQQFTQGSITATENPLDLAINGAGFFQVADAKGAISYTRNGQFKADREGYIVNNGGERLLGYVANAEGEVQPGRTTSLKLPTAPVQPKASSTITTELNLDARLPITAPAAAPAIDYNKATTYNNATSLTVYDQKGQEIALTYYFQKAGTDSWNVFATANGKEVGGTPGNPAPITTLTFSANGSKVTAPAGVVTVNIPTTVNAAGADTLPITGLTLDVSKSTQFGSAFGVTDLTQNGYSSGLLSAVTVEGNGIIMARYSNGQSKAAGQIEMANFHNPQGLQPIGNNLWSRTFASGDSMVGVPGDGNNGVLQSNALEESNVDLTGELVNMITAQRIYQANAQTIKTQDQVLQTLVNLR
jgi:flagellar hook protein FlgE